MEWAYPVKGSRDEIRKLVAILNDVGLRIMEELSAAREKKPDDITLRYAELHNAATLNTNQMTMLVMRKRAKQQPVNENVEVPSRQHEQLPKTIGEVIDVETIDNEEGQVEELDLE